jgi:hypothetical protein
VSAPSAPRPVHQQDQQRVTALIEGARDRLPVRGLTHNFYPIPPGFHRRLHAPQREPRPDHARSFSSLWVIDDRHASRSLNSKRSASHTSTHAARGAGASCRCNSACCLSASRSRRRRRLPSCAVVTVARVAAVRRLHSLRRGGTVAKWSDAIREFRRRFQKLILIERYGPTRTWST